MKLTKGQIELILKWSNNSGIFHAHEHEELVLIGSLEKSLLPGSAKLKQRDIIMTPDKETFDRAVQAFIDAGANYDPVLCEWDSSQYEYGVTLDYDNDIVSHNIVRSYYRQIRLNEDGSVEEVSCTRT